MTTEMRQKIQCHRLALRSLSFPCAQDQGTKYKESQRKEGHVFCFGFFSPADGQQLEFLRSSLDDELRTVTFLVFSRTIFWRY